MAADPGDIVVTLDGVVHAADEALVAPTDPMLTRADGVFETMLVRQGRACLLGDHLARLQTSARIAGLPEPDPRTWHTAVQTAVACWHGDGVLRLVAGRAVSFVTVSAVPARAVAARRNGLAAVTLDPGPRGALAHAKSLSYAVNSAALREAARRGADDVVFVDACGAVLEGPRSSVLIDDGDQLVSPPTSLPILAGTTVRAVFDSVPRCVYRSLTVADLVAAQGVWLLSAVTQCARVHTLDGVALRAAPRHAEIAELVDRAISLR